MAGKRIGWLSLALAILTGSGCCSWCDRHCGNRPPAYAPAYGQACVPCQPVCCPTPAASAPVCCPTGSSPAVQPVPAGAWQPPARPY